MAPKPCKLACQWMRDGWHIKLEPCNGDFEGRIRTGIQAKPMQRPGIDPPMRGDYPYASRKACRAH